ncbi:helix-turn-helix domain-containing protein [Streptomyces pseudovenezuelae]|uniref:Sugar diacid utilization regulator n=1 Tax=Streptomyces pseudovenezuelae TaxID=67350 RepID=A0ABT6LGI0_9ACTN|nr:sugar diacid utilization regulator [Streptomyces pseudovenezuelae]
MQDFAHAAARPCAAGTAFGPVAELADAHDRARRIGRATPLRQPVQLRPHTMEDTFVELAVADAPPIDTWLRTMARQLEPGPDLITTLDAYYRSDMNRRRAAATLNVHPRTLDYRLNRVLRLTGIDPASTRGVRILSTLVARRLAGAWE